MSAVEEWMNHKRHKSHKIDSVVLFCVLCAFCGSTLSNACPKGGHSLGGNDRNSRGGRAPEGTRLRCLSMLLPLWLGALNPVCGMGEVHLRVHGRAFISEHRDLLSQRHQATKR